MHFRPLIPIPEGPGLWDSRGQAALSRAGSNPLGLIGA